MIDISQSHLRVVNRLDRRSSCHRKYRNFGQGIAIFPLVVLSFVPQCVTVLARYRRLATEDSGRFAMSIIGIVQVAKQYLAARHHFKLCDNLGFGTILVDRELRLRGGVLVTPLTIQCRSLSSNLSVSSALLRGTGIFFPSVKSCHTPNHIRISSQ